MLCYATLRYAMLSYVMLQYAMLCHAMMPCHAMLCSEKARLREEEEAERLKAEPHRGPAAVVGALSGSVQHGLGRTAY